MLPILRPYTGPMGSNKSASDSWLVSSSTLTCTYFGIISTHVLESLVTNNWNSLFAINNHCNISYMIHLSRDQGGVPYLLNNKCPNQPSSTDPLTLYIWVDILVFRFIRRYTLFLWLGREKYEFHEWREMMTTWDQRWEVQGSKKNEKFTNYVRGGGAAARRRNVLVVVSDIGVQRALVVISFFVLDCSVRTVV